MSFYIWNTNDIFNYGNKNSMSFCHFNLGWCAIRTENGGKQRGKSIQSAKVMEYFIRLWWPTLFKKIHYPKKKKAFWKKYVRIGIICSLPIVWQAELSNPAFWTPYISAYPKTIHCMRGENWSCVWVKKIKKKLLSLSRLWLCIDLTWMLAVCTDTNEIDAPKLTKTAKCWSIKWK